jgi:hypothetical protein
MKHVMLDIETLGLEPGCVITALAMVQFDPKTGKTNQTFHRRIDIADAQKQGLKIDAATVMFWLMQSPEAQKELHGVRPLKEVLEQAQLWLLAVEPEHLWAKGPQFDIALLDAAYKTVGMKHPWHYRAPRCMRTILTLAGLTGKEPEFKVGELHNSLDDCLTQIMALKAAWKKLGLP